MPSIKAVDRQIKENDPPIRPNQIWEARANRRVIRRIRILARHPDPTPFAEKGRAWLFQEITGAVFGGTMRVEIGRISVTPEFNLRYVLRLTKEKYGKSD